MNEKFGEREPYNVRMMMVGWLAGYQNTLRVKILRASIGFFRSLVN